MGPRKLAYGALLVGLVLGLSACKLKNPSSPQTSPGADLIYKNGNLYPWGNGFFQTPSTAGGTSTLSVPMGDGLTGDSNALELVQTNNTGGPVTSTFGLYAVDTSSNPANQDMNGYYASGHLQFDLKLGLPPGAGGITYLAVQGTAASQTVVFTLNPTDYNQTNFAHVSVPIASVYPPSNITTQVSNAFAITYREAPNGSNQAVLYLNNIQWTTN